MNTKVQLHEANEVELRTLIVNPLCRCLNWCSCGQCILVIIKLCSLETVPQTMNACLSVHSDRSQPSTNAILAAHACPHILDPKGYIQSQGIWTNPFTIVTTNKHVLQHKTSSDPNRQTV